MLAFPLFCPISVVYVIFSDEIEPGNYSLCQIMVCETKIFE